MASRQYAIPGVGYINDNGPPRNYAVPGGAYLGTLVITHPGASTGGGWVFVATSIAGLAVLGAAAALVRILA